MRLESSKIWMALIELNPCRTCYPVQAVITNWASLYQKKLRKKSSKKAASVFEKANKNYNQGELLSACDKYKQVLRLSPTHLDARNNLALAQMHLENDLIAQIELEVVRKLDKTYIPALINLTVIYERNGQREKAEKLARQVFQMQKDVPQSVYNYAWYLSLNKKYKEADNLLRKMIKKGETGKIKTLHRMNRQVLKLQMSSKADLQSMGKSETRFWKTGILGGKKEWWVTLILILIFLFVSLFFIAFLGKSILFFMIFGTLGYFVSWGIPNFSSDSFFEWFLFILYMIIGIKIVVAKN
ncbi:hypothetical protein QUF72_14110 [Desulfobacterales bacterium HSG2]|nr:hypothetical protein [Desulfobacterales bacterium HSG2]